MLSCGRAPEGICAGLPVLARYRACVAMSLAPETFIACCTSTSASARPCLNAAETVEIHRAGQFGLLE